MWKGCVGIDILVREGRPSTEVFPVRFNDMRSKSSAVVPFMPLTNLLVEKVKCASSRFKWADVHDIAFLVSEDHETQRHLESKGLNIIEGCRAISQDTYEAACRRHPAIAGLLYRMMHIENSTYPGVHRIGGSFANGGGSIRSATSSSLSLYSMAPSSPNSSSQYTASL
jgi:hypothetical protein